MNLQASDAIELPASQGHGDRHVSEKSACPVCAGLVSSIGGDLLSGSARLLWQLPQRDQQAAQPRETIYRAGETLVGVPVVCDGWAARVSRLSDGRRQILSFVLPGDLVSTNALFAASLNFFVEAVTAVRHSSYSRAEINERLAAEPSLIKALVSACLAEKDEADRLALDLGRRRAGERLARLFLHLMERLGMRGLVRDQSFALPLRQQHIADATGLTPVHVNRTLGVLRGEGLIELSGGVLRIVNLARLQRLADVN